VRAQVHASMCLFMCALARITACTHTSRPSMRWRVVLMPALLVWGLLRRAIDPGPLAAGSPAQAHTPTHLIRGDAVHRHVDAHWVYDPVPLPVAHGVPPAPGAPERKPVRCSEGQQVVSGCWSGRCISGAALRVAGRRGRERRMSAQAP